MSKLHLLCELNDENYTLASFSFYENFQDAVQNAIKACKEWNEDCEIHAGKELRITANCGDSFYVTEIKQVWTELGTHLLVWHHGYQGVNFEVRHQGTYEDCKKAMEKDLMLVPGDIFGCPGHFRIAYCVPTERVEKALPIFQELAEEYL